MPRYIDADVLCSGRVCNDPVVIAAKCAPTLDLVQPVQCKNCKHKDFCKQRVNCFDAADSVNPITFCSYGEEQK